MSINSWVYLLRYVNLLRFKIAFLPNKYLHIKSEHILTILSTPHFPLLSLDTFSLLGRKFNKISHFLEKKMKTRGMKLLVQYHTARNWQCWDQIQSSSMEILPRNKDPIKTTLIVRSGSQQ